MISDKVKALLALNGKRQGDLAETLGIAKQSVANKMLRDSWSATDLMAMADLVGGILLIELPNGQRIIFEQDKEAAPGD